MQARSPELVLRKGSPNILHIWPPNTEYSFTSFRGSPDAEWLIDSL